ncbi:MAG: nucleotide exchange factor GrpE, partial [Streptococcus sp.]
MTEDIKKEDVKEEEVAQPTEEVVEESNQLSELEEAQARAEEFENKYLRA